MNFDHKLSIIACHYGNKQLMQTSEECAELIQAISKHVRKLPVGNKDQILEEIADVEIMTAQLRLLLNISETDIERVKEEKVNRQIERIKNENQIKKGVRNE